MSTRELTPTCCGYAAIIGAPNAGKSTLLNRLVGSKLAIVTPKEQTTRNRIRGISISGKSQIVFVDTPGIFAAQRKFEQAMVESAWNGVHDADAVLFLLDASKGLDDRSREILKRLTSIHKPAFLGLNKIDTVEKHTLLELASTLNALHKFEHIFMISARTGDGVEDIKKALAARMPQGPWLYPEDQLGDVTERVLAAEITREKLFMKLHSELPYSLSVETEKWEDRKDKSVVIHQAIYVERESQKTIVVGAGGTMLKSIGMSARKELERLLDRRVHLLLFVKVKSDWKSTPDVYQQLGLEYKS